MTGARAADTRRADEPDDELARQFYRSIKDSGPVFRTGSGMWVVAGHPEASGVLGSRSSFSAAPATGARSGQVGQLSTWDELARRFFIFKNGVEHVRLRRLVSGGFTNRQLRSVSASVDGIIRTRAVGIADTLARGDSAEMMSAYAFPVASEMICTLLGLPIAHAPRLANWGHALTGGLDSAEQVQHVDTSAAEIQLFISEQLRAGSTLSDTGLLSTLREERSGDRLTDDEVVATAALLLVAGFETSANFFGNLLLGLLWHPERYQQLVAHPELATSAIEELLRLYGPAHIVFRNAATELEVGGQMIQAGARIAVLLRAANRDPRVFSDPNEYRPERSPNPHLAFSHGVHYCLGAALARVEATAMLRALVAVAPGLTLSDAAAPEWEPRLLGRGLAGLEVAIR